MKDKRVYELPGGPDSMMYHCPESQLLYVSVPEKPKIKSDDYPSALNLADDKGRDCGVCK
jgi:hypothetical protein